MNLEYPYSAEKVRSLMPKGWEINDYIIKFSLKRKHKYCLVIPVINEGSKIINFIKKLNSNCIYKKLDIIIIDGGSNDGSINIDFFKNMNINSLLVMTSQGGVGSQLRIAYSFAMMLKYDGVITIDGNDKDDPTYIPNFIQLLNSGYDFVQSSRFISGGKHSNTPLIRYLAIRFIHAPLLSIASGFKWTDSTQGFRAYSKSLILSEKIGIFRSDFISYELLFYLSYIAPKKHFKCKETPSNRIYPKGSIPSKINNLSDYINIFKTLVKVCLGFYSL